MNVRIHPTIIGLSSLRSIEYDARIINNKGEAESRTKGVETSTNEDSEEENVMVESPQNNTNEVQVIRDGGSS